VPSHVAEKYPVPFYSKHLAHKINAAATTGNANLYNIMFTFIAMWVQVMQIRIYKTAKFAVLYGQQNWAFHLA
jgi:hypothetical protein